jgi:enamine deaminase RidA (YjgF/YER057c/UK114 family)
MYITDISMHMEVGKAHGEFFTNINPASTMVEVKALIHPDLIIEIEAEATID